MYSLCTYNIYIYILTVAQAGWKDAPKVSKTDIRYGVYGMPDNRLVKKTNTTRSISGFSVSGSMKRHNKPPPSVLVFPNSIDPSAGRKDRINIC